MSCGGRPEAVARVKLAVAAMQFGGRPAAVAHVKLAVAAMQLSLFSNTLCNTAAITRFALLKASLDRTGFCGASIASIATSTYDVDGA